MWEQVTEWLNNVTNNPLVISIVSILTVIAGVLIVFSKTSIGKKTLGALKEKYNSTYEEIVAAKSKVSETIEEVKLAKQELTELYQESKQELSDKVTACYSTFELFESDLFKVLEQVPNAKVQEQLKVWKETYQTRKTEVQGLLGDTYSAIQDQINKEVELRTQQSKEEIAHLKGEISRLNELVEQFIKTAENADLNHETEESEDEQEDENSN